MGIVWYASPCPLYYVIVCQRWMLFWLLDRMGMGHTCWTHVRYLSHKPLDSIFNHFLLTTVPDIKHRYNYYTKRSKILIIILLDDWSLSDGKQISKSLFNKYFYLCRCIIIHSRNSTCKCNSTEMTKTWYYMFLVRLPCYSYFSERLELSKGNLMNKFSILSFS